MKILKFGGTSVGSAERIQTVLDIIERAHGDDPVIVVVSALAGVTNDLIAAARLAEPGNEEWRATIEKLQKRHFYMLERFADPDFSKIAQNRISFWLERLQDALQEVTLRKECLPHILDSIAATGERLSVPVLVAGLNSMGLKARGVDAADLIHTDNHFGEAHVDFPASSELIRIHLASTGRHEIPVVTGFIGSTGDGITTTLGRNGSDYTATILASALRPECVEIWSDVDGLLTADPAMIDDAVSLQEISYDEAGTLAFLGAEVLHPKTIQPLVQNRVPLVIKNTFRPEVNGTVVCAHVSSGPKPVKTVTAVENVSLIQIENPVNDAFSWVLARLLPRLAEAEIPVLMSSTDAAGGTDNLVVYQPDAGRVKQLAEEEFSREIESGTIKGIRTRFDVCLAAVVGGELHRREFIREQLAALLHDGNIPMLAHSNGTLPHAESVVVEKADKLKVLTIFHDVLALPRKRVNLVLTGATGRVGRAFITQFMKKRGWFLHHLQLDLRIVGAINTRRMVWDKDGIAPELLLARLENGSTRDWEKYSRLLRQNSLRPLIFIDCTADLNVAKQYAFFMESGVGVVTPNKIANTLGMSYYSKLKELAEDAGYRYETTVGAATPFIQSLKELVGRGDRVHKIEGVFSGTLSYVFGRLNSGERFSRAVAEARELGYTEPHPAMDLSGEDVARKLLILIREAGYAIERNDIQVESLVPTELEGTHDPLEFVRELRRADAQWKEKADSAQRNGCRLVYVAHFDGKAATVRVQEVRADDPLAAIRGTQNVVTYHSDRFRELPLTLQGPGAGPGFTADGVLDDVVRVAALAGNQQQVTIADQILPSASGFAKWLEPQKQAANQ